MDSWRKSSIESAERQISQGKRDLVKAVQGGFSYFMKVSWSSELGTETFTGHVIGWNGENLLLHCNQDEGNQVVQKHYKSVAEIEEKEEK